MTWLIVGVLLAVIIGTAYLHYRDQQTHSEDPRADARRDHRQAMSQMMFGGSIFTVFFAWLRKRRAR